MVVDLEERTGQVMPGMLDGEDQIGPLGYDEVVQRLDLLADRVLGVIIASNAENANQVTPFEPMPRPLTALDQERERRERSLLMETERLIFGGIVLEGIQVGEE
jgi:hypothetical protein